ncbi:hypothetical protein GFK26_10495 [Variovorax paradoxus]|uniref:Apea-like HEPN domain-containing protein n=1 Tax=Variovorax paradoxus TaxID=34073 RepID=A0A5Q0M0L6_VARPD|nr:hypothetical protein [Variovorax paradoxus]QFZ83161.1 hypothetical protein GFK26_10495 [Variovorax paradoxus]
MQLSIQPSGETLGFTVVGRLVDASIDGNGALVLIARGFPAANAARSFFPVLQRAVALAGVNGRLAVNMPLEISETKVSDFGFWEGQEDVVEHGWPATQLPNPLVIYNEGAWVYPEHEYVALAKSFRIVPTFLTDIVQITKELKDASTQLPQQARPVDREVLIAASFLAHGSRSTLHVWRFLIAVTGLEMLADRQQAGEKTKQAIELLREEIDAKYAQTPSVQVDWLKNAIRGAKEQSIGAAVRDLVVNWCAPGKAKNPLHQFFTDEGDCKKKVSALYALRSQYVHSGRVTQEKDLKRYSFFELASVATASLHHILNEMLRG